MEKLIIGGLVLALLISLYWNYRQRKELVTYRNSNHSQRIGQLEAQIYQTDRNIVKARKDFWKLRLLVNEWNVFKGHKEIKELVEEMRNNSTLEEKI